MYSVGSLPEGTNVKLTVRGFSSDPKSFTADCIQYVSDEAAGFGANSPYMVISDITDTINEDDESVKLIVDELSDNNADRFTIISKCMNQFGTFYNKMTLTDWLNIVYKYLDKVENNL